MTQTEHQDRRAARARLATLGLLTVVCAYGLLASCVDDTPTLDKKPVSVTDTGGTDDAPVELPKFAPVGCKYTVTAPYVEGFPPFEKHADVSAAAPDLRYVRRGIGGGTSAGIDGYADPATSFAIGWQTEFTTMASRMRYGTAADKLDKTQDGFSFLVQQDTLKSGPPDGVRFHEVHVCGLEPGRTYYYQVGGGAAGKETWSTVYSLTTAPAKGGTDKVSFGIGGDSRDATGRTTQPVWAAIAKRIRAGGAQVAITTGDNVLSGYNQDLWDIWSKATGDAGTATLFAMTLGNHEAEFIRNYGHVMMPTSGTDHSERYGSFDWGPFHFVMIDDFYGIISAAADSKETYKPEVMAWLDSDLEKANKNRAQVPWIITYHHHPLYSSTTQTEREAERAKVRAAFQALWDKHHVNLDVAGHDHFYERNSPVKADKADPTGTTYVICAAAGAPGYSTKAGNPFTAKIEKYDPDAGQGIYAIGTADLTSFKVNVYKIANAATGSSPTDDTLVETFELTK